MNSARSKWKRAVPHQWILHISAKLMLMIYCWWWIMTIFILWCLYCNVLVGCMKAFFLSLNVQLEVLKTTNELFIHKSIHFHCALKFFVLCFKLEKKKASSPVPATQLKWPSRKFTLKWKLTTNKLLKFLRQYPISQCDVYWQDDSKQ